MPGTAGRSLGSSSGWDVGPYKMKRLEKIKLRFTITADMEILDLASYNAESIQEAARNAEKWIKEGEMPLHEVVAFADDLSFTVVGIDTKSREAE